ncbi:HNH endonuclease [Pseudomonas sp. P7]|uniref:HNH endonuclease n=1 Tax=Pseudomonas TaxID=286 RepID=UPI0015EBA64F|nr:MULTISPECIES: HNH endonuclease signature motif containing protein [Pseudomonas]MBA2923015.1 HNH endonuclease [Pseudomonas sivasensis]
MAVKPKALKELYARAAGRCAMCPGFESVFKEQVCDIDIDNKNISEAAHIIARSKKGPRGEDGFSGDIDDYDNLILLCPNHHKSVDDNPLRFPPDWLHRKKIELEKFVENSLATDNRRSRDISSLSLLMENLAFTRIRGYCESLPDSFNSDLFEVGSVLNGFPIDLPDARPFYDEILEFNFSDFEKTYRELSWLLKSNFENEKKHLISVYKDTIQRGNTLTILFNKGELYPYKESLDIQSEICEKRDSFIQSYTKLMNHLRFSYTEVNLNSYRPYIL